MTTPSDCTHETFAAHVEVHRIVDGGVVPRHFLADVEVSCAACGLRFHFVGPAAGLSFVRPTVSVGATTLHAPIAPGEGPIPSGLRYELPSAKETA